MPSGKYLTDLQKQQIVETYKAGVLPSRIAKEFGVNRGTIFKAIRGFVEHPPQKRLTDEQRQMVIDLYVAGCSAKQIKQKVNVSASVACDIARAAGVIRKKNIPSDDQKQAIIAAYLSGKTTVEVAKEFGTSSVSVSKYCKDAGIEIRPAFKLSASEREEVILAYNDGASINEIALKYDVSTHPISSILQNEGLTRYKPFDYDLLEKNKDLIIESYQNGVSVTLLEAKTRIGGGVIRRILKQEGVQIRGWGQASLLKWQDPEHRNQMSLSQKPRFGELSSGWKGGRTKLTMTLRTCKEYKGWRMAVFVRDSFTCQHCGTKGKKRINPLQSDHIYPFSALLRDNQITYREQAMECEALWNIDNGRTLCKSCHEKTDTYQNGAKKYIKQ